MNATLTDSEWAFLCRIPESDLIDAAADLDLVAPAKIDRRALLESMLPAIIERARAEGLPFSKYDADDLRALSPGARSVIAGLQGLGATAKVPAMLKAGQKVYKTYLKTRPHNPVALLLPSLLPVIARVAGETH